MQTFNHESTYQCVCGKTFTNSQSFNGHKSHCKVHLKSTDKYEQYLIRQNNACQAAHLGVKIKSELKRNIKAEQWISEQHTCEKCGKIMTEKYGSGRFCSRKCANSRPHSEEDKIKISQSLCKFYGWLSQNKTDNRICSICGQEFTPKIRDDGKISHSTVCSDKCRKQLKSDKARAVQNRLVQSGLHQGWKSRNIQSYPEQFWQRVLDNNNVSYSREYSVKTKDKHYHYFLDFLVANKIDVEIDGKQHRHRQDADNERDKILTSMGYIVYRIPWINPVGENSVAVEKQIDDLLLFISNNLDIKG